MAEADLRDDALEGEIRHRQPPVPPPSDEDFAKLLLETEALALYVGRHGDVLDDEVPSHIP